MGYLRSECANKFGKGKGSGKADRVTVVRGGREEGESKIGPLQLYYW